MRTTYSSCTLFFLFAIFACFFVGCDIFGDNDDDKPAHALGDTLWIHESSGSPYYIKGSLALDKSGNIIYAEGGTISTWELCRIACINKDDGTLNWISPSLDFYDISSEIVVGDDGVIYVIGHYTLYAINPENGQFLWTWEVPETLPHPDYPEGAVNTRGQIGALALTNEGNLVLSNIGYGHYARNLYTIDTSGNILWYNLRAIGGPVISGIYIGVDGHLYFYHQTDQGEIVSMDVHSGEVRWRQEARGIINENENNILIHSDGSLICSFQRVDHESYRLHGVDPANGNITWSSTAISNPSTKWLSSDGRVYQNFPSEGGINFFDVSTGLRQPFFSAQNVNSTRVSAINQKNQLLIVHAGETGQNRISVFHPDGKEDWHVEMANLDPKVMLISDDKVIYGIINEHSESYLPGKICAIQGNEALASSGWPRQSHDNRNTFNVNKN